jgi:hypothetical protein
MLRGFSNYPKSLGSLWKLRELFFTLPQKKFGYSGEFPRNGLQDARKKLWAVLEFLVRL